MMRCYLGLAVWLLTVSTSVLAKDLNFSVQARLTAGMTKVDPGDVNEELSAQSMKNVDHILHYGAEITFPVVKVFNVGLRYNKRNIVRDEDPTNYTTTYEAEIDQDSVMAILRLPFLNTNLVRFDVFGGVGGANTTMKIKTATQDGEISRKESNDWFATPVTAFGGSVALGWKNFYLVIEGGVETNQANITSRTGTVNTNISQIDLNGSYFTVGLLLDGVKASSKR